MITIRPAQNLSAEAQFGLRVLIDLSRLLRVADPEAGVVGIEVQAGPCGWPTVTDPGMGHRDGAVTVTVNLLEAIARLVTATQEQAPASRLDRNGRVVAADNEAVARGTAEIPIVSQWAADLRGHAAAAAGDRPFLVLPAWPGRHSWAVGVTHDVDVIAGWPVFLGLRIWELVRKGAIKLAARAAGAGLRYAHRNPVIDGVRAVLAAERNAGIRGTWFFLAGDPSVRTWSRGDVTYSILGRRARQALEAVLADRHEIGLHGSLATSAEPRRFGSERGRLAGVVPTPVQGVRQHFLAIHPGATHAHMAAAGFGYDATMGFYDRSGFRLGVADTVPMPTPSSDSGDEFELVPLVWMDRAASKYRGVERPQAWVEEAVSRAATCRQVGGLFTALWHPNLTAALGFPDADGAFGELIARLQIGEPWFAPLGEIVEWRRARRAVLARSVSEGRPQMSWRPLPFAGYLALEDATGKPVMECTG